MPDLKLVLLLVFAALLGGFFNRVRGGLFTSDGDALEGLQDEINAAAFALFCWFVAADFSFGVWAGAAMYIGAMSGWGSYVGALHGRAECTQQPEIDFIDELLALRVKNTVLYGFCGLTLRGVMWATPLAFLSQSVALLAAGALMGGCYWLASYGRRALMPANGTKEWELSEIVWGATYWPLVVLVLR